MSRFDAPAVKFDSFVVLSRSPSFSSRTLQVSLCFVVTVHFLFAKLFTDFVLFRDESSKDIILQSHRHAQGIFKLDQNRVLRVSETSKTDVVRHIKFICTFAIYKMSTYPVFISCKFIFASLPRIEIFRTKGYF